MRAKFACDYVKQFTTYSEVQLSARYSDSPEDNQFSDATPYGEIKMGITAPAAQDWFTPGGTYYLDFTPADAKAEPIVVGGPTADAQ